MNRPIRRVAVACAALFAALLVNANWIHAGDAENLRKQDTVRQTAKQLERERGSIIAGGKTIAVSVAVEDQYKYLRRYPDETASLYSNITGYFGPFVAATGLERAENNILSGEDDRLFVSRVSDLVTNRKQRGGTIVTTLVPEIQEAAAGALQGRKGAVVALDPRTGEVLAMVSNPSFDPNFLASHDRNMAAKAHEVLENDKENQPLLNRPTQETYPPGSTFKVVTSAAALRSGRGPNDLVASPRELQLPRSTAVLRNFGGEDCGGDQITLTQALTISCNTAFAQLGMDVGAGALRAQAEAFGLNTDGPSFPLRQATSVFPTALDPAQTAQSAIGQYNVKVTPLQMAEVVAAIGNNGVRMQPYLVKEVLGPDMTAISRTSPKELGSPVSPDVAASLTEMMRGVVNGGTGRRAQISGVQVAGKTGTAEHGAVDSRGSFIEPPHAWFVGFAPAGNPRVAVAVLIEDGGGELNATGGATAAPVAKQVMETTLRMRPQ